MYNDYDPDDYEDELQKILEGRDVEPEPEEIVKKNVQSKKSRPPRVEYDDEPLPEREEDDLDDFIENDYEEGEEPQDAQENREDEAKEVPAKKPRGPRRVSLNPRPKLDADRLKSKKGLVSLLDLHSQIKLKGKGFEEQDLNCIMFALEHWAHRLFPKLAFDDFLEKAEQLGPKRAVSTFVKKMRMDLPLDVHTDVVDENADDEEQEPLVPQTAESLFDEIIGASKTTDSSQNTQSQSEPAVLTQEQRELIAQKRLEAIEKRKKAQMEKEKQAQLEKAASQLVPEEQMAALMDMDMDMDV